jgi:Alpha/beta hydrolase domain
MRRFTWWIGVAVCVALTVTERSPAAEAQDFDQTSCDEFLLEMRAVNGKKVGPASCLMQETDASFEGRTFRRLDIGLDGTVDGFVTRTGDYKEYLTNAPDLVFPQTADAGPVYWAVAAYRRDKGASMTVIYPLETRAWNGKMWVTVHGRGAAFKLGNLKAWNKNLDRAKPLEDLNKYERLILSKGYVLVKTRRTSAEGLGEITATLEDGSTIDDLAFNDSHRYIMDFTALARKAIELRLGRAPTRTYFYGHSAGARIGRGLNYTPGLNRGADGRRFFDGILADDSAAGGWLPVVMKNGKDVLFANEADKAGFVPQLDISHQMYNNIWSSKKPDWMSASYLENKRRNARILRDKGLATKARMYEVRSISHSGGESLPNGRRGEVQILDLSKLMDRFLDMLDDWVDNGREPPPTRSDWSELGDVDRDGLVENPGLAFPEVACPLGVYYSYPTSTAGTTSFAAFTGEGLEPLDERGVFVDMNRNGVRDMRETPTQAWRRLGLLRKAEELTRETYAACIARTAGELRQQGFFSERTKQWYVEQSMNTDIQPRTSTAY